jgi:hypothetical protein
VSGHVFSCEFSSFADTGIRRAFALVELVKTAQRGDKKSLLFNAEAERDRAVEGVAQRRCVKIT